ETSTRVAIWNIRLPRVVGAFVCGWGLALSGLTIQTLLKNPLASPSTIGISQGAAFGAAASIVLFEAQMYLVTGFAFAGAMGATAVVLALASLKRLSTEAVVLSGVALSSLFTSGTILLQFLASDTQLAMVVFWTFGDVARAGWQEIVLMGGGVLLASVYLYNKRWDMNALLSGEESAKGLGVNVTQTRTIGVVVAALVAALATAFFGVIAFVGLVAPHMARRLIGADHRMSVPFSCVLGALLLLASDTIGRVIIGTGSLPVGVITSCLGAPMFLYLLVKSYR
ncbi:MAG: iron ABC transporter permease, partial [Brachymonas sp.]|nr:iron ABC transporter permease [Brachymonas sp.]